MVKKNFIHILEMIYALLTIPHAKVVIRYATEVHKLPCTREHAQGLVEKQRIV